MRIIFSRDRPAQLDLLLRSMEKYGQVLDDRIAMIVDASKPEFVRGYEEIGNPRSQSSNWFDPDGFDGYLREILAEADDYVTFFCDDDILFREVPRNPSEILGPNAQILSVCLYLGRGNTKQEIPEGFPLWEWGSLPRHDFGFPCAVDGNTYRVRDVLRLIGDEVIPNPTMLETVMALRLPLLAEERPLMSCFEEQCLVGVPVNRVSPQSGVAHGRVYPQSTEDLNARFLARQRIDLEALDFSGVDSCHHEIEFKWGQVRDSVLTDRT